MKRMTSDAVSPVVGVMLMLVVTIIIAAVVSAFAGGVTGDKQKTPQATVVATVPSLDVQGSWDYVNPPTYPAGYDAKNGILFENKGGDAFSLNDISVELENQGVSMIVTSTDELPSSTCLPSGTTSGGYFVKVGDATLNDKIISPGDKFMFYADNNYVSGGKKYLLWIFDTGYGYGPLNDLFTYAIIDKKSGGTISKGQFLLK